MSQKNLKSTATITSVVDHLESRGLVERIRGRDDHRYVALPLTEKGTRVIGRAWSSMPSRKEAILD